MRTCGDTRVVRVAQGENALSGFTFLVPQEHVRRARGCQRHRLIEQGAEGHVPKRPHGGDEDALHVLAELQRIDEQARKLRQRLGRVHTRVAGVERRAGRSHLSDRAQGNDTLAIPTQHQGQGLVQAEPIEHQRFVLPQPTLNLVQRRGMGIEQRRLLLGVALDAGRDPAYPLDGPVEYDGLGLDVQAIASTKRPVVVMASVAFRRLGLRLGQAEFLRQICPAQRLTPAEGLQQGAGPTALEEAERIRRLAESSGGERPDVEHLAVFRSREGTALLGQAAQHLLEGRKPLLRFRESTARLPAEEEHPRSIGELRGQGLAVADSTRHGVGLNATAGRPPQAGP